MVQTSKAQKKAHKPHKTAVSKKASAKKSGTGAVRHREQVVVGSRPQAHKYFYAVGRRKSAVARVRFFPKGEGGIFVNAKKLEDYFAQPKLQTMVREPLVRAGIEPGGVTVKVLGGGLRSQAESVRHGLARALLLFVPASRQALKAAGLLRRDARVKERKKYGLKRARRAPQWQKR